MVPQPVPPVSELRRIDDRPGNGRRWELEDPTLDWRHPAACRRCDPDLRSSTLPAEPDRLRHLSVPPCGVAVPVRRAEV